MSGLFAALLLRRHGWDVRIFERSDVELSGRGAGIVTHPELRDALAAVGLEAGEDLGVPMTWRRTLDRDGRVIGEYECPQIATSWNKMFQMLRDAFPAERYCLAKDLQRIEQFDHRIFAHFSDGSTAEGDLLVGADGFRSTVRAQYLPEVQPLYAGYVAWRGLVPESALSPATHKDLFAYFAFCLPPGEQMLGYPVAGPGNDLRPGHRSYNVVWYRPADEKTELQRLLTDETGRTHAVSIPPPLIARDVVREMREHAEDVLAPQFREVVRLTDQPFLQPIYDLEAPRMAFGRVAILGDAAFVARPHVGAGVVKAAQDAIALVEALGQHPDIEAVLRRFEEARRDVGRRIIQRARHLGAYMQSQLATAEERMLAERHRTPQAVMAETALLDFLRA
ncbi:MAG: FAD binding domain-containing protein [Pseudomonadota bacterium]|nr:FAD binding domain-containing protein [Pseudomonadota bacterium]